MSPEHVTIIVLSCVLAVAAVAMRFDAAGRVAEVSAAPEPVWLQGDEGELRELLFALLDNALIHGAGQVTIDLRADPDVVLTVENEGKGLPAEAWELVFERFHKQSPTSPGSGLGLAIVRQTARGHGGEARFVAPGAIEVRLPV